MCARLLACSCVCVRQISKTRTFLGSFPTELAAARAAAKHMKCSIDSLRKAECETQSPLRPSPHCGVVLEAKRQSYRVKVGRRFGPRFANEKDAATHAAELRKSSPQVLRKERRRPILFRLRTLLAVMSGVLPADLEDFVVRYPNTVKLFQAEPALVVISAMWKFGPARDALATAWQLTPRCPSGLSPAALPTRERTAHLHKVLVKAVKLLHGVDMPAWAANVGRSVTHHQGWLAWCQLRVPIICSTPSGTLRLGQQRCSRKMSCKLVAHGHCTSKEIACVRASSGACSRCCRFPSWCARGSQPTCMWAVRC